MLKQRILTAILLAPILLGAVIYGNHYVFAFVVFVIQTAATYEWLKINQLRTYQALVNAMILSFLSYYLANQVDLFSSLAQGIISQNMLLAFSVLYAFVWLLGLLWLRNHKWGYQNTAPQIVSKTMLGVLAIILFGFSLNELYEQGAGRWLVMSLFLLIWVADIGAYVSGKTMGKHKLAVNISPGKTWEGVIGAQILVAIYAVVVATYLAMTWQKALLLMIPVALFSVVGDLVASLGKRQANVKDSSNLLPGHGGFVDRFDSLIAAAPLFYVLNIVL
ncbi:phosphatidate cytidylyltransferase [Marinicella sp. S1101]|uniref:phosphatidate cytidylyltransferase n=1 Tax=Marinicella marina TaxID=2996016 RepID=UPI002260E5A1|nr:phosphatidate cytidylyltransferase [Marinicella marina]MCX7554809.1 phosphatidate cytidylyltransferase [Marinicella marina]MDJ1140958.1 phosphatidate cytidylyltransferase [Marinicella marina]